MNPTATYKSSKRKGKKAEETELVNVNVEEYKHNPEAFEEEIKKTSGTQVIIQFRDSD